MQRTIYNQSSIRSHRADSPHSTPDLIVDVLVIGAGFAGCYLLHNLRKAGFSVKVVEAGSDLGGIWHWNSYPGARVDSQWPIYALSLPEVYEDWTWSEQYPGHEELKRYFQHMGRKLDLYKDVEFGKKVVSADWDENIKRWKIRCEDNFSVHSKFLIAGTGFAAKRHFPAWEGLDSFKGVMHHSSFWPQEGVDVRGKRVAVIGTGATGIQIVQECAKEIGDEGSMVVFQRTPNLAYPMRQKKITKEEDDEMKKKLAEVFKERLTHDAGFMYSVRKDLKVFDHSDEERERFFEDLWEKGGFRFLANSYGDILLDQKANDAAYNFWARKVRARINDPRKRDILAPLKAPHVLGGKRPSLEQDYYDAFNKPNVDIIDVNTNPIQAVVPEGLRMADGKVHEFDVIALATGFDSVTGGLKDIDFRGTKGELLRDKWAKGTWTYLGITTSSFPNFFFLYGPQAPTAFSNGPSCVEPQADWILNVLQYMRSEGKEKLDPTPEAEQEWRELVHHFSALSLRHNVPGWYNGANIPGKPREPLNYSGGLPDYMTRLSEVRHQGMKGFQVS